MAKYKKNIRNLFEQNLSQMWFNAQKMEVEERANTIAYIIGLNKYNGGFIDYKAKYFMAQLIDQSECYYNGKGLSTKVKEFDKLGWYVETGKNIQDEPIYSLDFNKVMAY